MLGSGKMWPRIPGNNFASVELDRVPGFLRAQGAVLRVAWGSETWKARGPEDRP